MSNHAAWTPTVTTVVVDALYFSATTPCGKTWPGMRHTADVQIVMDRAMDHAAGCSRCEGAEMRRTPDAERVPPHTTCVETTASRDLVAGKRSWLCGSDCPRDTAAMADAIFPDGGAPDTRSPVLSLSPPIRSDSHRPVTMRDVDRDHTQIPPDPDRPVPPPSEHPFRCTCRSAAEWPTCPTAHRFRYLAQTWRPDAPCDDLA